jgi:putative MATE family efflux protein
MKNMIDKSNLRFSNKYLAILILPLLGEQLLAVLIGMADSIMVASVGEAAISGVSLIDSLSLLFIFLFSAFSTGGAVVISQYLGKKDNKNAKEAAKQLFFISFLLGIVIALIFIPLKKPLVHFIFGSIDKEIEIASLTYFNFVFLYFPFLGIYTSVSALFRSLGNSKISLKVSLLMNVLNVSFNALFIFVFKWGVFGAGLATLISRIVAALLMLFLISTKDTPLRLTKLYRIRLEWTMLKRIFKISVPNAIENSVFQIGKIVVQSIVASLGLASIAANVVVGNLCTFGTLPGVAISLAAPTIIGQCLGAGEKDMARYYLKLLFKISLILIFSLSGLLILLMPFIIKLYSLSDLAYGIAYNTSFIVLVATAILWTSSFALPNFLRAAGDVKFTLVCSLISMSMFRVGGAYLLTSVISLGLMGVWLAMIIDWVCRSTCFLLRARSGKWADKKVI